MLHEGKQEQRQKLSQKRKLYKFELTSDISAMLNELIID